MKKETEDPRKAADKDFVNAGLHEFNGKPLQKFTVERQIAATLMGLKFGYVEKEDEIRVTQEVERAKAKGKGTETVTETATLYRQLFQDVVIVLWLCAVNLSDVFKAQRKPEEAMHAAQKWAGAQGFSLLSPVYSAGVSEFFSIMAEIQNSRSTPVSKEGGDDDDDDDPPGE